MIATTESAHSTTVDSARQGGHRRNQRHWPRMVCTLGPRPVMRMPRNTGAIVVHSAEVDPSGAVASFTGTWRPRLTPNDTRLGELVLQLLEPSCPDGDEADRVDVRLWLARRGRWVRLGAWTNAGPGWPHQLAPWIHAALGQGVRGLVAARG